MEINNNIQDFINISEIKIIEGSDSCSIADSENILSRLKKEDEEKQLAQVQEAYMLHKLALVQTQTQEPKKIVKGPVKHNIYTNSDITVTATSDNIDKTFFDIKTIYYNDYKSLYEVMYNDKINKMLLNLFPQFITDKNKIDREEIFKKLYDYSGYEIIKIDNVVNMRNKIMLDTFKFVNDINTDKILFHGTNENSINKICKEGFNNISKRSMYGYGIYLTPSIFIALLYSTPNDNGEQFIIVSEFAQGPTALGHNGQTDYGIDENNKPILTLTNSDKTILCAKSHNQTCVQYVLVFKYNPNRKLTVDTVHPGLTYNKDIWTIIQKNSQVNVPVIAPVIVPVNVPAIAPVIVPKPTEILTEAIYGNRKQYKIKIGDTVIIDDTFDKYDFAKTYKGVVKYITKQYKLMVYVLAEEKIIRNQIIAQNKKAGSFPYTPNQDETWLAIPPRFVTVISSSTDSTDKKRKKTNDNSKSKNKKQKKVI